MPPMTFCEQLTITLVDKAAIGALLLGAGFWLNRLLERFKSDLQTARDRDQRISEAQFRLYSEVWSNLQDLKAAGDRLWERCMPETLSRFIDTLGGARLAIGRGRLILTEAHHKRLQVILEVFDQFEIGKRRLIEIRSEDLQSDLKNDSIDRIRSQIEANRQHKDAYERLLDEILPEFRRQLNMSVSS